jgi:hypothetical protein
MCVTGFDGPGIGLLAEFRRRKRLDYGRIEESGRLLLLDPRARGSQPLQRE